MEQIVTVSVSQMAGMENVNMDQEKNMGLLYLERLTAFRLAAWYCWIKLLYQLIISMQGYHLCFTKYAIPSLCFLVCWLNWRKVSCYCKLSLCNQILNNRTYRSLSKFEAFVLMQNLISCLVVAVLSLSGVVSVEKLNWKLVRVWIPVNVIFVGMLVSGMYRYAMHFSLYVFHRYSGEEWRHACCWIAICSIFFYEK